MVCTTLGLTGDIEKRIREHDFSWSKFTSANIPWKIIYTEVAVDFEEGRKGEKYLKTAARNKFVLKQISSE